MMAREVEPISGGAAISLHLEAEVLGIRKAPR
jgi:hypothetical protein